MDDTLYLERDYVISGFSAVGRMLSHEFEVDGVGEDCWKLFTGGSRGTVFDEVVQNRPELSSIDGLVSLMVETYRAHVPAIDLLPDAVGFLEFLRGQAELALITDGPPASQRAKIEALGLSRWISLFVVTGEHGPGWTKPSLRPFRSVEAHFNAPASSFVYIGDNPLKDFEAPRMLGWRGVRVQRRGSIHFHLATGAWPPLVVEDLRPLARPEFLDAQRGVTNTSIDGQYGGWGLPPIGGARASRDQVGDTNGPLEQTTLPKHNKAVQR